MEYGRIRPARHACDVHARGERAVARGISPGRPAWARAAGARTASVARGAALARTRGVVVDDQREVRACLERAETYGPECLRVDRHETHSAVVYLAGPRAYKLKRAVRYDYLDFSTVERRRRYCELEIALNRRTAPTIYRRAVALTREAGGGLVLDGSGPAVEWLVEMTRFPDDAVCDRRAADGRLPVSVGVALADAVAALHALAERRTDKGGAAGLRWVVDGNDVAFQSFDPASFPADRAAGLSATTRRALDAHAAQLDERRNEGFVRQCHGDLHLGNVVMLDDVPTLFDAVEFNDDIACVDTAYDLAFLLMDLWHRRLAAHANVVLGEYLRLTGDVGALHVLPLLLACRAAVRAKVSATQAELLPAAERAGHESAARAYLDLAARLLEPRPAVLIAIGGRSGTGKTTVAAALAPRLGVAPGAWLLRSDVERKMLFGVTPGTPLPAAAYSRSTSDRVYAALRVDARLALDAGHTVICDAVFGRARERAEMARVANDAGVPFIGLWLDVSEAVAAARVEARQGDASDADTTVVREQSASIDPPHDWRRIDAAGSPDATVAAVAAALGPWLDAAGP